MPQPFLALITPLTGNVGDPPQIWGPTDPRPTPPIVIPPESIAPGVPTHPIYLPVYPAHPIVIPPGAISPGPPLVPAHPIVLPPYVPAHPIVIPPDAVAPGVPAHPIYLPPPGCGDPPPMVWGGAGSLPGGAPTWGGAGQPGQFPEPKAGR